MSITVPTNPRRIEKTLRKSLAVPLTDAEVKERTEQMVNEMTELERLEIQFAADKKETAAEIKEMKASINKARKIVTARVEVKLVDDAVRVQDLDSRKQWYEYRGEKFDEMTISDSEMRDLVKPPLFPEHDDAEKEQNSEDDSGVVVEAMPSNVSDIEEIRRSEAKKTRKDHTASR